MKELNFFIQPYGDLGIPIHSRALALALINKLGSNNVNLIPISRKQDYKLPDKIKQSIRKVNYSAPALLFWYPTEYDSLLGSFPLNLGFYIFEISKIPEIFVEKINKIDKVLTASQWGCEVLKKSGVTIPCIRIPGGVDTEIFNSKNRNNLSTGKCKFLVIGKHENRKGTELVIRAFDKVFKNHDIAELVLSIDNPHDKRISSEEYVKNITDAENIQIVHFVKDIRSLYDNCHIFVNSSKAEGLGLSTLEAMACGMPVISSNYSGMSEYIDKSRNIVLENLIEEDVVDDLFFPEKGKYGTWMSPTVDELAEKMIWAYENYNEAIRLGKNAEKWIKENYTWEKAAEIFIKECL